MTTAQVVIGGAYGDEGKGLVTDALANEAQQAGLSPIVVRFNGGAQAGHTVCRPDGRRHVFHHWGAGALAGASTHLGQRFVVHPMLFAQEHRDLQALRASTRLSVDPRARVTLPFDVMINQAIELQRGNTRHGSCGVGFGETCQRNESASPDHHLTVGELAGMSYPALATRWRTIAASYVPARLATLGLPEDSLGAWLNHDGLLERFVEDCNYFLTVAELALPNALTTGALILEGAQGLALDEDLGAFPYVTRSKTGLPWALEFLNQATGSEVPVMAWYLTRAYTTRHGAGPLPHEQAWQPPGFEDQTNQPNPFQGTLRLAPLDPAAWAALAQKDIQRSKPLLGRRELSLGVSVSCLDQMDKTTPLAMGQQAATADLGAFLAKHLGASHRLESHGPSREAIQKNLARKPGVARFR